MPGLNRLDVLSENEVWAAGLGGYVITYQPGQDGQ